MKKMLKGMAVFVFLMAFIWLPSLNTKAETADFTIPGEDHRTNGGFYYNITEEDTIVILSYFGTKKQVIVPDTVDGKIVTKINAYSFQSKDITSIQLPESISYIGNSAFENCVNLKTVKINGSQLLFIGNRAFYGCSKLVNITLPDSLLNLGNKAFGLSGLKEILIPGSIQYFGDEAFRGSSLERVVLDRGLEEVSTSAFLECEKLVSVSLPQTLTTIKEQAFYKCKSLTKLAIPKSVITIEINAFESNNLKTITCFQNSTADSYGAKNKIARSYVGPYFQTASIVLNLSERSTLKIVNKKGDTYFESMNPAIASVSAAGVVKGLKSGSTTIRAENNGWTIVCQVQVTSSALNKDKVTVTAGFKTALKVSGASKVKWSTSDKAIASVSDKGIVTGLKKGTAVITATVGNKKYTCKTTVKTNIRKLSDFSLDYKEYPSDRANILYSRLYYKGKSLAVETYIFNNTNFKLNKINKLTLKLYQDGKEIGQQTISNFSLNMDPYSSKKVTLTIKDANIKSKNMDLRAEVVKIASSGGSVAWGN